MPDIPMCQHLTCPAAKVCYRHEAKPSAQGQSYQEWNPIIQDDGGSGTVACEGFVLLPTSGE